MNIINLLKSESIKNIDTATSEINAQINQLKEQFNEIKNTCNDVLANQKNIQENRDQVKDFLNKSLRYFNQPKEEEQHIINQLYMF